MDKNIRTATQRILHKAGMYAINNQLAPAIELAELALTTMQLQVSLDKATADVAHVTAEVAHVIGSRFSCDVPNRCNIPAQCRHLHLDENAAGDSYCTDCGASATKDIQGAMYRRAES